MSLKQIIIEAMCVIEKIERLKSLGIEIDDVIKEAVEGKVNETSGLLDSAAAPVFEGNLASVDTLATSAPGMVFHQVTLTLKARENVFNDCLLKGDVYIKLTRA